MEIETNLGVLKNAEVLRKVVAQKDAIVEAGLKEMIKSSPVLAASEEMQKSCRFDLLSILRVISYACAVETVDFLHMENILLYKILYDELGITLVPLIAGISAMRAAVADPKSNPSFDKIVEVLKSL